MFPAYELALADYPDRQPPGAPNPLRPVLTVIEGLVLDPGLIEEENLAEERPR